MNTNKRSDNAGRKRITTYEYSCDKSLRYKFVDKYESQAKVRATHYSHIKGNMPLFRTSDTYHILPNGNVLTKERVGRKGVVAILAMERSPYVNMYKTKTSDKKIECYNIIGEKMAEFKNIAVASKLTGMSQRAITSRINTTKNQTPSTDDCLIFNYK